MKINLGCGSEPLNDYVNVDMDTLNDLRNRYPNKIFSDKLVIKQWDIFNLPIDDNSVDEVRADCLFEHLSFIQEKQIFFEVKRVLKTGGKLNMCVPDFETIVKLWLQAEDNWKDWYRTDHYEGEAEIYKTWRTVGPFNGENRYWMNIHRRVFRANDSTARLTISDWAGDSDPGGPIGQELIFNAIEV